MGLRACARQVPKIEASVILVSVPRSERVCRNCSELVRRIGELWGRWLCHITWIPDLRTAERIIVRQQALSGWRNALPSWKGKPNPKAPADARSETQSRPSTSRLAKPHGFARARMTPTHRVEHVVEQCPDHPVVWLGPAHLPAAGSGAGNRARLPDPHLSPLPTLLCSQSATGRRGDGQAAPGDQRHQPDCGPAGGSQVTWIPCMGCNSAWGPSWRPRWGGGGHPGTAWSP